MLRHYYFYYRRHRNCNKWPPLPSPPSTLPPSLPPPLPPSLGVRECVITDRCEVDEMSVRASSSQTPVARNLRNVFVVAALPLGKTPSLPNPSRANNQYSNRFETDTCLRRLTLMSFQPPSCAPPSGITWNKDRYSSLVIDSTARGDETRLLVYTHPQVSIPFIHSSLVD